MYTSTISAIITVVKMLVLYRATKRQKKRVAKLISKEGFTKEDAKDLALGCFNLVKEIANKFITLTRYSSKLSLIN
jgi:hypothetical protein